MAYEIKNAAQNKPGLVMRAINPALGPACLALFFIAITTSAHAENIYRWVDENGRAHYTDKQPNTAGHTQIHVPAAPVIPQAESESAASGMRPVQNDQTRRAALAETDRKAALAAKDSAEAYRRRREADSSKAQASMDSRVIAACNRNREVYCDKGVGEINRQQQKRKDDHEEQMEYRRSHPELFR